MKDYIVKGTIHRFLSNSNPDKFCPKLKKNECKHKIKQYQTQKNMYRSLDGQDYARIEMDCKEPITWRF